MGLGKSKQAVRPNEHSVFKGYPSNTHVGGARRTYRDKGTFGNPNENMYPATSARKIVNQQQHQIVRPPQEQQNQHVKRLQQQQNQRVKPRQKQQQQHQQQRQILEQRNKKECTVCGHEGHSGAQCYHRKMTCYICNTQGHLASVCKQTQHHPDSQYKPKVPAKRYEQRSAMA